MCPSTQPIHCGRHFTVPYQSKPAIHQALPSPTRGFPCLAAPLPGCFLPLLQPPPSAAFQASLCPFPGHIPPLLPDPFISCKSDVHSSLWDPIPLAFARTLAVYCLPSPSSVASIAESTNLLCDLQLPQPQATTRLRGSEAVVSGRHVHFDMWWSHWLSPTSVHTVTYRQPKQITPPGSLVPVAARSTL